MVIQLFHLGEPRGYIPTAHNKLLTPFFSGGNMALRKQLFTELGGFDESMKTGEDLDFCVRTQDLGWELYYDADLKIEHLHRDTLGRLARQWFGYGFCRPALLRKHNDPAVEIAVLNRSPESRLGFNVLYWRPSRVRVFAFVTAFTGMHAFAGLAGAAALPAPPLALAFAVAAGVAAVDYFRDDFKGSAPLTTKVKSALVRYVINGSLLLGGLIGGLKNRVVFVDGMLWKRPEPSDETL